MLAVRIPDLDTYLQHIKELLSHELLPLQDAQAVQCISCQLYMVCCCPV